MTTISFSRFAAPEEPLADAELLEQIGWSRTAPESLKKQVSAGKPADLARVIRKTLSSDSSVPAVGSTWAWSQPSFPRQERLDRLVKIASARKPGKKLAGWLATVDQQHPLTAWELLIATELLLETDGRLPDAVLVDVWRKSLWAAICFSAELRAEDDQSLTADERLLLTGELPWRLGLMFSWIGGGARLARDGAAELKRQLLEYTDTDGTPFAAMLPRLHLWLASLTRAVAWQQRYGTRLWKPEASDRYRQLVALSLTLVDADGRIALTEDATAGIGLLQTAVELSGLGAKSGPAKLIRRLARRATDPDKPQKRVKTSQRPVLQSDWANLAGMRSSWDLHADQVTVAHHASTPQIHVNAAGCPVLGGDWQLQLKVGGRNVHGNEGWDCVCWNSDNDIDYLELQWEAGGVKIERQIALSRKRRMLFLADCVHSDSDSKLDYHVRLPLQSGLEVRHDPDTRECTILANGQRIRVFPLSLPEDRVLSAAGSLEADEQHLGLRLRGQQAVYAPLAFCWDAEGRDARADWRTLTVTESRRILTGAESAAHRLRVGSRQWLFYRRLNGSRAPQTVLGMHTLHESVLGEFRRKGTVKPLLLVNSN